MMLKLESGESSNWGTDAGFLEPTGTDWNACMKLFLPEFVGSSAPSSWMSRGFSLFGGFMPDRMDAAMVGGPSSLAS